MTKVIGVDNSVDASFEEVKEWYNDVLHPDRLDLNDEAVYDNVYSAGKFCATFQYTSCFVDSTPVKVVDQQNNVIDMSISNIDIGMNVISYDETTKQFENQAVTNVMCHGEKDCIELTFEDGRVLTCTLDHKFLTKNRGWVVADDLTEYDDILQYT